MELQYLSSPQIYRPKQKTSELHGSYGEDIMGCQHVISLVNALQAKIISHTSKQNRPKQTKRQILSHDLSIVTYKFNKIILTNLSDGQPNPNGNSKACYDSMYYWNSSRKKRTFPHFAPVHFSSGGVKPTHKEGG